MDAEALQRIPEHVLRHVCIIRHGVEIFTRHPEFRKEQASCARPFVTTAFLMAIQEGLISDRFIDRPVREVYPHLQIAQLYGEEVCGCHVLSYTARTSPSDRAGQSWVYSGGSDGRGVEGFSRKHWPRMHLLFLAITNFSVWSYLNDQLFRRLGGNLTADSSTDTDGTTCRVTGTPRDMARAGYFWLRGGRWHGEQLIDPALMRRAVAGGPMGDGRPLDVEGWQFHLVKNGRAWEKPKFLQLHGVPDGTYAARDGGDDEGTSHGSVIVVPSLDLVIAYRGGRAMNAFLPQVCGAVIS
jgi:hypothetical protein